MFSLASLLENIFPEGCEDQDSDIEEIDLTEESPDNADANENLQFYDNPSYQELKVGRTRKRILTFSDMRKPYKCNICGSTFTKKSNLNRHHYIHEGRFFKCPYCECTYTQKSGVDIHVKRKHTFEKKYACSLCPYRSVQRWELIQHNMVHKKKGIPSEYLQSTIN